MWSLSLSDKSLEELSYLGDTMSLGKRCSELQDKAEGKRQMTEGNKETTEPERQLLERYAQGERDFRGASLEGVNSGLTQVRYI